MTDRAPDDLEPELGAAERARLEAWTADAPPADLADRVIAAARGEPATSHTPVAGPRRHARVVAAFLAGALVTAAATVVIVRRPDSAHRAAAGARVTTARESIALGHRGIAVAEPGASLAWHVDADGAARVEQSAGDVFYRVEPGGTFVVATAAGEVRVTGTCFRVEIQMKPSASSLKGAAVGAALAAVVVVTVYEGGVVVAGSNGDQRVAAGERVVVGEDASAIALGAPPPVDITRDQLLVRDATQRRIIAELTARVAGLEPHVAGPREAIRTLRRGDPRDHADDDGDGRPWFDPSPELLAQFAAECRIRFDTPPIEGTEPFQLPADYAAEAGIAPAELTAINAGIRELHARWKARLIALYLEATGEVDRDRADAMSPSALAREIEDKGAEGEADEIRARIARERAGLARPPADLSQTSPVERYLRSIITLGDEMETIVARAVGPERARALRELNDGWGSKHEMSGCSTR